MTTDLTAALIAVAHSLPADSTMIVPSDWVRSLANAPAEPPRAPTSPSLPLLTVAEAATRIGFAPSYLYRHQKSLPFLVQIGSRGLRADPAKLDRWLSRRSVA